MRFTILTLFPEACEAYFNTSILKRAQADKKIHIQTMNIRDFAHDKHHTADGKPYGGGAGMVLMAEPILKAYGSVKWRVKSDKRKVIILSAKGKQFNQKLAYSWAKKYDEVVLISGRYEGIDERVQKILKAEEISIGPYVLTDGEVAAMAIVSAVARLIPGVIRLESLKEESHWDLLLKREARTGNSTLEYPHYTRPEVLTYKGKKYRVPLVLLSGDHKKIEEWRREMRKTPKYG